MAKSLCEITQVTPFFLKGDKGFLFTIYYPPKNGGQQAKQIILHIPAFAEEMNKSRRMIALQAREFSDSGYAVLIVDLFGTGDSEGEFAEASWSLWKQDLQNICQYLDKQGFSLINLWGIRTGALLGMQVAAESNLKFHKLLMWQPVLNGETFVMQFLRLRVAAAMMKNNSQKEKISDLKKQLLNGKKIEVAGYMVGPELINPLLSSSSNISEKLTFKEIILFEITTEKDKGLSPVYTRYKEEMLDKENTIQTQVVVGNSFWVGQEISEIPELLAKTNKCISSAQ